MQKNNKRYKGRGKSGIEDEEKFYPSALTEEYYKETKKMVFRLSAIAITSGAYNAISIINENPPTEFLGVTIATGFLAGVFALDWAIPLRKPSYEHTDYSKRVDPNEPTPF